MAKGVVGSQVETEIRMMDGGGGLGLGAVAAGEGRRKHSDGKSKHIRRPNQTFH